MIEHYDVKSFVSTETLGYLLRLSNSLMYESVAAAFADRDLTLVQWIALMRLREGHSLTASDLRRTLRHDSGALTRVLNELEARGYLRRARSNHDRRVVELELTAAGRLKATELMPVAVNALNEALVDFSREECAELCRLLTKLVTRLQATEASRPPRTDAVF